MGALVQPRYTAGVTCHAPCVACLRRFGVRAQPPAGALASAQAPLAGFLVPISCRGGDAAAPRLRNRWALLRHPPQIELISPCMNGLSGWDAQRD